MRDSVALPEDGDTTRLHQGETLLRQYECTRILGLSHATFWRRISDGTVPKPIKLGGASRWPLSEILAVIERAKAQREAA